MITYKRIRKYKYVYISPIRFSGRFTVDLADAAKTLEIYSGLPLEAKQTGTYGPAGPARQTLRPKGSNLDNEFIITSGYPTGSTFEFSGDQFDPIFRKRLEENKIQLRYEPTVK